MSQPRAIRVPLAVDAQFRLPIGPMLLPIRSLILAAAVSPIAFVLLNTSISLTYSGGAAIFLLLTAASFGVPVKEGVWVGTWWLYHYAWRVLPTYVNRGEAQRAQVTHVGASIHITKTRKAFSTKIQALRPLNAFARVPQVSTAGEGLLHLDPGGYRGVLVLEGPATSAWSDGYLEWCQQAMHWISSLECPVQFLTVMAHFDQQKVQEAFDRRTAGWPRTRLLDYERQLAGDVAMNSLGLRHYVVLLPHLAPGDGIPTMSRLFRVKDNREATEQEADRYLKSALRMAPSFGINVQPADRDDMVELLHHSVLGAPQSVTGEGDLRVGDQHHVVMTTTQLPPTIEVGAVVEAMMRTHSRGVASLHIMPVDLPVAQKHLHKRSMMLNYAARKGADTIEAQVALQDTTNVVASLAQREIKPVRIALTLSVCHNEPLKAYDSAERLGGILSGYGFNVVHATSPGFLPALALAPGCAPLGRSLLLTADTVALRLLPCLGTPFSDVNSPLLGMNVLTGAPAYFSIWKPANHNMVIVGSSGAGKSVSAKTLLLRHLMEGVNGVVIDPDSEYKPIMDAVGGEYFELGNSALNPLAAGLGVAPDTAAGMLLPILSVMGGDEKGIKDGRPIRRLPDEDQGWLHAELVEFYKAWNQTHEPTDEPVMHNLLDFLESVSQQRALTAREADRCRIIIARLRRFTQGTRALVFDRPSTFAVGTKPVAIGLKVFAMTYGADLTPALAVVLTSILSAMEKRRSRMIVAVDEAHRVTCDPDAGEVLGQLVRQARKYGAGVWMMSQRVEDFVRTDLGRTLAATASTKLILGSEEAVIEEVAEVFKLRGEEIDAICPMSQGRGVLLSGSERTTVYVVPGPAVMALADTSQVIHQASGATSGLPPYAEA